METGEREYNCDMFYAICGYVNASSGKYNIQFLDSMAFMNSSLDKLAKKLTDKQMVYTMILAQIISEERGLPHGEVFTRLREKGVYPYEWMNDILKVLETQPPPMEAFISSLSQISEKDDPLL